jgi:putative hemolysin
MSEITLDSRPDVIVRLATCEAEIRAAQNLRYQVFYKEMGAVPSADMQRLEMDFDVYDDIADHLIVIDRSCNGGLGQIVGTYRLMREDRIAQIGRFYSASEYDLSPLTSCGAKLLELGRSCVLAPYRTRPVLQALWDGIAEYLLAHQIDLMFGCGSLPGTDPQALAEELSYLHYYHLAPPALRAATHPENTVAMNILPKEEINPKTAFMKLPPLLKGYMRVGCMVGKGAYIDRQWNSVDVCIIMPTMFMAERYARHYERRLQKPLATSSTSPFADALAVMLQQAG